jgi:uncharacterized Zn finger protein (UPF0148 family)
MAEEKICPACGKPHYAADVCPWCGAKVEKPAGEEPAETSTESKANRVIRAKIATKKQQVEDISQTGPFLVVCLGILVCITIVGILLGLIIIGLGIWWGVSRDNEEKKLKNEIKELEIELEP